MEIVSIEKKTFEAMVAKFDRFVCRMLNISPRTLQTLRDNGTLAFSKIGNKTYYLPEDVRRIVTLVEDRRKAAKYRGREI